MTAIQFAPAPAKTIAMPPQLQAEPQTAAIGRGAHRHFSVRRIANHEVPEPAAPSPAVRSPHLSSIPPPLSRETFDMLLKRLSLPVAGTSKEHLEALRARLLAGDAVNGEARQLDEGERRCLLTGLNLELLQHPGAWNDGLGDLQPLIVNSAAWPAGRALRIVDTDTNSITLYRQGEAERRVHHGDEVRLPEPEDNEVILLRHARHFSLIQRDQDKVVREVPHDGDCFFSCISLALGADDCVASNLTLRSALAEHIWDTPEALEVAGTWEGRLVDKPAIVAVIPKPPSVSPAARNAATPTHVSSDAQPASRQSPFAAHGPFARTATDPQAKLSHGLVRAYNRAMKAHLANGPLADSDMQRFHQQLKTWLKAEFSDGGATDEHAHKVLDDALQSAFSVHVKRNEAAVNAGAPAPSPSGHNTADEDGILQRLLPEIGQFYASQMNTALADDIYSPAELRALHDANVSALLREIGDIQPWASEAAKQNVASELLHAFPAFKQRNQEKMKQVQQEISKAINKTGSAYIKEIEDMLQKHPSGVQPDTLLRTHHSIVKGLESTFPTSLLEIRRNEPIEGHWQVVKTHIDNYWTTAVVPANEAALAKPAPAREGPLSTTWKPRVHRTHALI